MSLKKKKKLLKKGDYIVFSLFLIFFTVFALKIKGMKDIVGSKAEVYVEGKLVYIQKLQKEEKKFFINTDLGGVNVEVKEGKIRVISSNSPKKIVVKQGWIKNPGDLLIGIPDKLIIKITGEGEDDLDYVAR